MKGIGVRVGGGLMNAGSRVPAPVLARRFWMSMPRSPSLPTVTGSSSSSFPIVMRTVSATALSFGSEPGLSRGAAKESSPQAAEQPGKLGRRGAEVVGRFKRRSLAEPPRHRAGLHSRGLSGRQIDRTVAHHQGLLRFDAEAGAEEQEAVGGGLSGTLVAADDGAEGAGDAQPVPDLARGATGPVGHRR